jgi:hypothetical protein
MVSYVPNAPRWANDPSADGGATKTSPLSWNDNALPQVFSSKYTKSIPTYYPYVPEGASSTPSVTQTSVAQNKQGFLNGHGYVLGIALGITSAAVVLTALIIRLRRKGKLSCRCSNMNGSDRGLNRSKERVRITSLVLPWSMKVGELSGSEKHTSVTVPSELGESLPHTSPATRVANENIVGINETSNSPTHELECKIPDRSYHG